MAAAILEVHNRCTHVAAEKGWLVVASPQVYIVFNYILIIKDTGDVSLYNYVEVGCQYMFARVRSCNVCDDGFEVVPVALTDDRLPSIQIDVDVHASGDKDGERLAFLALNDFGGDALAASG